MFETITTEMKKTKCYQGNNCSMTECGIISRFLTGEAKGLYSNKCWKALNQLYKDNKMFETFKMWVNKITTICVTCGLGSICYITSKWGEHFLFSTWSLKKSNVLLSYKSQEVCSSVHPLPPPLFQNTATFEVGTPSTRLGTTTGISGYPAVATQTIF